MKLFTHKQRQKALKKKPTLIEMLKELDYIDSMCKVYLSDLQIVTISEGLNNGGTLEDMIKFSIAPKFEFHGAIKKWFNLKVEAIEKFTSKDTDFMRVHTIKTIFYPLVETLQAKHIALGQKVIMAKGTNNEDILARKVREVGGEIVWSGDTKAYQYDADAFVVATKDNKEVTLFGDLPIGTVWELETIDNYLHGTVAKQGKHVVTMTNGHRVSRYVEFKGQVTN